MKKLLTIFLCAALALSSTICVNAKDVENHKGFELLGEESYIPNNTLKGYAYNIDENCSYYMQYRGYETKSNYNVSFLESMTNPVTVAIPDTERYTGFLMSKSGGGGNLSTTYGFSTTGGKYKKIKIKLSEFSDYFNEDGSHTMNIDGEDHNFLFKDEQNGFHSGLAIISGAAVNGVTPDENGEVELFVSTNIGTRTIYKTTFRWKSGGGGGTTGTSISKLTFGNMDANYGVDVNDVTFLQLYLAGLIELDTLGLFHADVNCDNKYNVQDVTALQIGLSKL